MFDTSSSRQLRRISQLCNDGVKGFSAGQLKETDNHQRLNFELCGDKLDKQPKIERDEKTNGRKRKVREIEKTSKC